MGATVRSTVNPADKNLENIRGTIVGLASNEIYWKPESGEDNLELNRMKGIVSTKVPNEISDFAAMCVIRGVRSGRLIILESEVKADPVQPVTTSVQSDEIVTARRLLDEKDTDVFEELLERQPLRVVEACKTLEKSEGGRDKFLDIISNRLKNIR